MDYLTKRALFGLANGLIRVVYGKVCEKCGGSGLSYDPGNWYHPPETDFCWQCVQKEQCPRCGNVLPWDEEGEYWKPCLCCGWDSLKAWNDEGGMGEAVIWQYWNWGYDEE